MNLSYYRRPLFILLAFYAAGIFAFRGFFLKPEAPLPFGLPRYGAEVEGRIAEYPVPGRGGWRFALDTAGLYGRPFRTGLMVYSRSLEDASYGDTVSFLADLKTPPGASVPGGLDWAGYLYRRGIVAEARATDLQLTGSAGPVIRLARSVRASALGTFGRALAPEPAAVFGGVVLGEKRGVPPDLKTAFQDSGAMHLLVASGSNVGFVVAVVYFLCARLGLRRRYSGLAALGLSGMYVIAAGGDPPLVRAYLMFSAGLLAWLLRRDSGAFHALTAACLGILVFSPRSLFDAGFQMSFLAAYGLTAGMSAWSPFLRVRGLAGKALGLFVVSFFAQLFLYPVLAVYFHRISLVSLLSNMVLVPASALAMGLGFLLAALPWAGPVFGWLSAVSGWFMAGFIWTVRFFAGLPFAAVSVPEPSPLGIAGGFVLAFAFAHAPLLGFRRPRLYGLAAAGAAVLAAGVLSFPRATASGRASGALLFGDSNTRAALVSAPSGGLFLVNPGVNGRKLAGAVLARGSKTLEAVMLTSLEKKNYSGLPELAGLVKIKSVLLPYGPRPPDLEAALAALEKSGTEVKKIWPGEESGGASCGWEGASPGYSGAADRFSWKVGDLTVTREGARADMPGAAGTVAGGEAVKGAITAVGNF
jgi:competence protein ComEC